MVSWGQRLGGGGLWSSGRGRAGAVAASSYITIPNLLLLGCREAKDRLSAAVNTLPAGVKNLTDLLNEYVFIKERESRRQQLYRANPLAASLTLLLDQYAELPADQALPHAPYMQQQQQQRQQQQPVPGRYATQQAGAGVAHHPQPQQQPVMMHGAGYQLQHQQHVGYRQQHQQQPLSPGRQGPRKGAPRKRRALEDSTLAAAAPGAATAASLDPAGFEVAMGGCGATGWAAGLGGVGGMGGGQAADLLNMQMDEDALAALLEDGDLQKQFADTLAESINNTLVCGHHSHPGGLQGKVENRADWWAGLANPATYSPFLTAFLTVACCARLLCLLPAAGQQPPERSADASMDGMAMMSVDELLAELPGDPQLVPLLQSVVRMDGSPPSPHLLQLQPQVADAPPSPVLPPAQPPGQPHLQLGQAQHRQAEAGGSAAVGQAQLQQRQQLGGQGGSAERPCVAAAPQQRHQQQASGPSTQSQDHHHQAAGPKPTRCCAAAAAAQSGKEVQRGHRGSRGPTVGATSRDKENLQQQQQQQASQAQGSCALPSSTPCGMEPRAEGQAGPAVAATPQQAMPQQAMQDYQAEVRKMLGVRGPMSLDELDALIDDAILGD